MTLSPKQNETEKPVPADRSRLALDLVDQALAEDPSDRSAWLEKMCAGDDELEAEVAAMLDLVPAAREFLPLANSHEVVRDPRWSDLPQASEFVAGSQLGEFQIEKQIGAGGMGVVYRARQLSLNRPVALKVLPPYLRSSTHANTRFRREIEAVARLHHTNIVSVYATGDENGTLYYAMELIEGPPLSEVLEHLRAHRIPELHSATPNQEVEKQLSEPLVATPLRAIHSLTGRGPQNGADEEAPRAIGLESSGGDYFDRVARALADAADALGYAHDHDVVHRDVKPSNLLLSSDGRLHVGDFGLARFIEDPRLTRTGECLGTPYYMAPEQVSSEQDTLDGRVDVYGLGATLYELLTLQPPFVGATRDQIITQITHNDPLSPRQLNKRAPHDLQTICLKALEKNPTDRYPSCADMAADLRAYVNRFAISARRTGPIVRATKWARRHRGLSIAMAFAGALALIAGFFAANAHRSQLRWTEFQQEQVIERVLMAALEGKGADADTALAEAKRLGAPRGRLQLLEGQVDLIAARYTHAHQHFLDAADEMPDSVAAQSLLAYCCLFRQQYEQAEELYHRCETLQPHSLEDYLHLARLEAYFDAEKAVQTLDRAVDRNRKSLVARLIRGEVQVGLAHDTVDPDIAEAAVNDYRIAAELLGDTPLVTSGHLRALLAEATAFRVHGETAKYDETLRRAREVAEQLSPMEAFRAHRTLAFYYDYIGDVERAIAEWQKFQHRQILYLVLTLVREGRIEDAMSACGQVESGKRTERELQFFRALIKAAAGDSPANIRATFPAVGDVTLDPIHELISVYTISRLVEPAEETQRQCRRLAQQQQLPALRKRWLRHLSKYACGEMTDAELLTAAGEARKNLCEAHYYIALTKLAAGDRRTAQEHFQSSIDTGVFNYFEHYLSRALLAQLGREPDWPKWIDEFD